MESVPCDTIVVESTLAGTVDGALVGAIFGREWKNKPPSTQFFNFVHTNRYVWPKMIAKCAAGGGLFAYTDSVVDCVAKRLLLADQFCAVLAGSTSGIILHRISGAKSNSLGPIVAGCVLYRLLTP